MAQEASALGYAEAVGVLEIARAGVALLSSAVLEKCPQITRGQQTTPRDRRARGGIDHLVDLAGLNPRAHVYVRGIGHDTTVVKPREAPLVTGNDALRRIFVVLLGQHRILIVQLMRGICTMNAISQVLHACGSVRHK